ncbi:MAG: glycoside hydrolase family 16 protein, partial [Clostridia bacterium]|nr:glycoside hydrolase family 16 protein [Clostridia bacterium]
KDSPDYFGGRPCSSDPGNLLWAANGIQTWEKNYLHPGGKQQREVEPFEGYATQYGYFEIRMKLPDTGGGGYASWWLIGAQDDARADGTGSRQNGEIDIFETFFDSPGVFEPKVHAWDDPELSEWSDRVNLDGKPSDYKDNFHTYAMDWRPEGITFFVDDKAVAETKESPQYRMCMILSMYINSDFSGWDDPENRYPMEWLIDYVRVYKYRNGYDENNRLSGFERFIKDAGEYLISLWQRFLSFIDAFCENPGDFFRNLIKA